MRFDASTRCIGLLANLTCGLAIPCCQCISPAGSTTVSETSSLRPTHMSFRQSDAENERSDADIAALLADTYYVRSRSRRSGECELESRKLH